MRWFTALFIVLALVVGCAPSATPAAPSAPAAPATSWPRVIQTASGPVTVAAPPQRIHALSLGHEEMTLAIVPPERVAAVSTFALDPALSNSVEKASRVPTRIGRDPEAIIAAQPDVIIASSTTRRDLVDRLQAVGVPVLVPPWADSIDTVARTIRWLGEIYGTEDNANRLATEVEERLARIDRLVATKAPADRPTVALLSGVNFMAGANTARDAILRRAGARNAAAEAGLEGNRQINLEAVVPMNPQWLLSEADPSNPTLTDQVRANPAIASLPATREGRLVTVRASFMATLSHYQVRGVEEVAKLIYPADLGGVTFSDFR